MNHPQLVSADEVEVVVAARASVGEGPVWDEREQALTWIDIPGQRLHRYSPLAGASEIASFGGPVGFAIPREAGGFVIGLGRDVVTFDPTNGDTRTIVHLESDGPHVRLNDGKCDERGRLWTGTTDDSGRESAGALYCIETSGSARQVLGGLTESNGLDWDPAGTLLYHVDTPTGRVDVLDYDGVTGGVGNRRKLMQIDEEQGYPDGLTVDAEGFIWVALWGGSAVRRYTPDGRLERCVQVPATNVTSCVFGGRNLDELYITSATFGMTPAQLDAEPAAGSLFRYRPNVTGRPARRYGG